jgi:hypothetical protein
MKYCGNCGKESKMLYKIWYTRAFSLGPISIRHGQTEIDIVCKDCVKDIVTLFISKRNYLIIKEEITT